MPPRPRLAAARIEALEPRIAPSALALVDPSTVTYTDTAGDKLTFKFSKPVLTPDNVASIVVIAADDAGNELMIDLAALTKVKNPQQTALDITLVPVPGRPAPALIFITGGALTPSFASLVLHEPDTPTQPGGDIFFVSFNKGIPISNLTNTGLLWNAVNVDAGSVVGISRFFPDLEVLTLRLPQPVSKPVALGGSAPLLLNVPLPTGAETLGDLTITEVKLGSPVADGSATSLLQLRLDTAALSAIDHAVAAQAAAGNENAPFTLQGKSPVPDSLLPAPRDTVPAARDIFAGVDRIAVGGTRVDSRADGAAGQPPMSVVPVAVGEFLMGGYEPKPVSDASDRSLFDVSFLGSLLGGLEED